MRMNREQFLTALREHLAGLPQEDIDRSVDFYREMIDDRMEDGLAECDAVAAIGPAAEIAAQIRAEAAQTKPILEKIRQKHPLKVWKIVLLALGSPVWLPLLLTAFLLVLVALLLVLIFYMLIWVTLIVFYAADVTIAAGALAGLVGIFAYLSVGNLPGAVVSVGAGLVCAGLSILLFFGCNWMAKKAQLSGILIYRKIKSRFKRNAERMG